MTDASRTSSVRSGSSISTAMAPSPSISSTARSITSRTSCSTPPAPSIAVTTPRRAPSRPAVFSDAVYVGGTLPSARLVAGSAGSTPTVASRASARSSTDRASGPPMSCVRESGTMPSPLASPRVPRSPASAWCAEGMRIDPQVSLPMPKAPKLAATAAPVPPLDPPGLRSGSYGLRVWPPREAIVVIPRANSMHVGLAEEDCARLAETPHLGGVVGRHRGRKGDRAGRRGHVGGVVVVLHHDRNPVQRAPHRARGALRVELRRALPRPRVDGDNRIDGWALLVEGRDARQVAVDEIDGGGRWRRRGRRPTRAPTSLPRRTAPAIPRGSPAQAIPRQPATPSARTARRMSSPPCCSRRRRQDPVTGP